MPFLAYIAIILVSLGGILFELNWLTSPKLETKPAVQASKSAAPPKVAAATIAPREETAAPANEAAVGPRNVAPNVTMVPGDAVASKAAETQPDEPTPNIAPNVVPTTPQQQTASAPAVTPAPVVPPTFNAMATTGQASGQTTGEASTDFKREFSTDEKADSATSSATFTPAVTTPTTPALAASTNNKCDIAACSAAYQSFRASDCSYQPIDGTARKMCDRTRTNSQQASMPVREHKAETAVKNDAAHKPNKEAGLRAFEREVRRITASEANLDTGDDRDYGRGGRSQVIVIERSDW